MRYFKIIRMVFAGFSLLFSLACPAATAVAENGFAATGFSITASPSGGDGDLTLTAQVQVAPADNNQPGDVYTLANIYGLLFFKSASGAWVQWTGGAALPPYYSGALGSHTIPIFDHLNLNDFPGVKVYVGYGLNQDDMINNSKFAEVYTVAGTAQSVSAPPPVMGSKFPVASNWAASGTAFDGTHYLVSLESDTQTASVAAQMMSSGGTQIGSPVAIGQSGQSCCSNIAFDGTHYLMIWEWDQGIKNSGTRFMIYGQFIDTAGAAIGQPFALTTAGIWQDGVKMLAYGGGKYLLVYTRIIDSANTNNRYVAGRIVSPDGTLGNEFRISDGLGASSSIAFDGTNFFVVWQESSKEYEVRGRFVSPSGALGQEISVNASLASSDNPPSVAFDGTNYLVAWNDEVGGTGSHEWDIFGQRISPNGALVGNVIPIVTEPGAQIVPTLTFDGTYYLAVWIDAKNDANGNFICDAGEGTCWDVYGRYIGKDGSLVGNEIAISTDPGNQMGGVISFNGKSYVGISSGIVMGKGGPSQVGDTYGVFITP
ncbi:MAG: hypothetical protein K8F27_03735 [Sulfuricellaceae bacterium]|nr:hypothetical protein [Sulfuricellaceae bacterium]